MNCMKVIVKLILSILLILPCSCTKELTDEEDVYKVTNHGKSLFIYLSSGDLLESQTKDLDISKIEELEIQGHVGGFNLAFLRDLSGGTDSLLLGGKKMSVLNLEKVFFDRGKEVYYSRNGEDLTINYHSEIPAFAFEGCYVLKDITLPDMIGNVININKRAFANCILLKNIVWGHHVRKIKEEAFINCSNISNTLIIPGGVVEIGDRAFKDTHPVHVEIPSTIKTIGYCAFSNIIGDVVIRSIIPPTIKSDSFVFHKKSGRILFVPSESIGKYKQEPYTSIFSEIKAIEK